MVGKKYSDKHLARVLSHRRGEIGWRSGAPAACAARRRTGVGGIGMATQIWGGGGGPPAYATVHVNPDGTVVAHDGLAGHRHRHAHRARADLRG